MFQSTLPWWERHRLIHPIDRHGMFQSTLPWWERHNSVNGVNGQIEFQSTLPWWERPRQIIRFNQGYQFQSTLPWWERPDGCDHCIDGYLVSIHAPMVGATVQSTVMVELTTGFNPRSRGGSDDLTLNINGGDGLFQSTLPWWERPSGGCKLIPSAQFQSTLPWWERPVS